MPEGAKTEVIIRLKERNVSEIISSDLEELHVNISKVCVKYMYKETGRPRCCLVGIPETGRPRCCLVGIPETGRPRCCLVGIPETGRPRCCLVGIPDL